MHRTQAILLALATVLVMAAAAPAATTVRFAAVDIPPLFVLDDGRPAGVFGEIVDQVAREQGWQVQYVPVSWDEGLRGVQAGELDMLPTAMWSEARDSLLDYNQEPVLVLWSEVYIEPDAGVATVLDLAGKTVAVMSDDMNADNLVAHCRRFGVEVDTLILGSTTEIFAAVRTGRADAGVVVSAVGQHRASEAGLVPSGIMFDPFPVYFATTEGQGAELLAAVDAALLRWREDPQSPYYRAVQRWLGQAAGTDPLPGWALVLMVTALVLAAVLLLLNRILDRRVQDRTRELAASEQRLRALFETAGEGIFLLRDGLFVDCNPRVLEQFRCRQADIIGKHPGEFSPPEQPSGQPSLPAAAARIDAARTEGVQSFEWRHRRLDGTDFDAEVTLNVFELAGEQLVQVFVRDITRRKRLEADLRQAQKMEAIGTLAGGIAHDFNNILSAIMGYNELARLEPRVTPEVQEHLGQVDRAALRARNLVQQILAFSRRGEEPTQVVALAPVIAEAVDLLRSTVPSSIEIQVDLDADVHVRADSTSIHQVVVNLATNAVQAMGEAGTLSVGVREAHPGSVVVTVGDDGPGIPQELQDKIFEPYFTTRRSSRGTGLGLAVVHGIVDDLNGAITVDSAAGKGTTFRIVLPTVDEAPQDLADEPTVCSTGRGGERILLVDDEADIVASFRKGLERLGYQVEATTDPQAVARKLRDGTAGCDILVTDMTMPGLTGRELTELVQAVCPELPVIVCTGYSDDDSMQAVLGSGAADVVMKPVDSSQLARRIRSVLDGR